MAATRPQAWEVWWVRWWHEDAHDVEDPKKQRSALCLGDLSAKGKPDRFVFCQISTQPHDVSRVEVAPDHKEFAQTGLRERSFVYVFDVKELETADAIMRAGTLGLEHIGQVRRIALNPMKRK